MGALSRGEIICRKVSHARLWRVTHGGARAGIQGKRLVLTIDPAQRLRTALNLNAGMVSPEKIPLDAYSPKGELWAALLDIRASLDRMVRRDTPAAQAETVLSNPIYALLTSSIGGMQEL